MPYTEIPAARTRSGRAITESLLEDLRDNSHVPKAPQGCTILTTGSGTWRAPSWCEQIKVTCFAGGGNRVGDLDFPDIVVEGADGGGGIVWHTIARGASISWAVGAQGGASNFGTLISCTGASGVIPGGVTLGANVQGVRTAPHIGWLTEITGYGAATSDRHPVIMYGQGAPANYGPGAGAPGVIMVEF